MFSIKRKLWKNWSETVIGYPEKICYPKHVKALKQLVYECKSKNRSLRVVGAGHSFTPLAATSNILVSLEKLNGIASIDHERSRVTVWAGTKLKALGEALFELGYAMENLGDINAQSIAGAISTGTHGTGTDFGSLSTQITALTILTPSGDLLYITKETNLAYFQAMRLSLGMLGIIVQVEIQVIPAHRLVYESFRMQLDDCLSNLRSLEKTNRHFEFYWFPHTNKVQAKIINSSNDNDSKHTKANTFNKIGVENGIFKLLSEACRLQPKLSRYVSTISANTVPIGKEVGNSHELYVTPRLVKFQEMEYSVPAECMAAIIKDIQYVIEQQNFQVHFPIECRYVKEDDIWLSPAYKRNAAYIAVHMYKGMEFQPYFDAIEEIFQHYNGRPHWGKMHTMTANKLAERYPKMENFLHIREELDPDGMLLNSYLRRLFNI